MKDSYRITNQSKDYSLYKEWSLWSKMLGKILLLSGPESSGKTTLMLKIIDKFPNWKTINHKKIAQEVFDSEKIQSFFFNYLAEISNITGKHIITLEQLYQINDEGLTSSYKIRIKKIKNEIAAITTAEYFRDIFLTQIFLAYYDALKQYIFAGDNVIIDEVLVSSEREYGIFRYYCNYPNIKRMLLFNTMSEILEKCIIRNNKFLTLLNEHLNIDDFIASQKKMERETGSSSSTCRMPGDIIKAYKRYYHFKVIPVNNDIILEETTLDTLQSVICRIAKQQLSLIKNLVKKGYIIDIAENLVDVSKELQEIFGTAKKAYVISKTTFEYIIKAPGVTELTELDNAEFLQNLLKDVFEWKDRDSYNYSDCTEKVSLFSVGLTVLPKNNNTPLLIYPCYTMNTHFVQEWNIWCKCFGKVLIINGNSCSGKTTLSKYLGKFGFHTISLDDLLTDIYSDYIRTNFFDRITTIESFVKEDDFTKILFGFKFYLDKYTEEQISIIDRFQQDIYIMYEEGLIELNPPTLIEKLNSLYDKAKIYIFSGQNVVIDIAEPKANIDLLAYAFRYYPITVALLYNPLKENLKKCFHKNEVSLKTGQVHFRFPKDIIIGYQEFYKFVPKSDICQYDYIIEKTNKAQLIKVLGHVTSHQLYLNKALKSLLTIPHEYEENYTKKRAIETDKLNSLVSTVTEFIKLENSQDIFMIPLVEFNYIINPNLMGDNSICL